MDTVVVSSKYQ